jgi:CHASE2 domain-containing sensor protein
MRRASVREEIHGTACAAPLPCAQVQRCQGDVEPGRFRDKIVVIGATAPSIQDVHPVSWPGGEMDGPEIHANAIATLLAGAPLRASGRGVEIAIAIALAVLAPLLALVTRPWIGLAIALGAGFSMSSPPSCSSTAAGSWPSSRRWWGSRSGSSARCLCTG